MSHQSPWRCHVSWHWKKQTVSKPTLQLKRITHLNGSSNPPKASSSRLLTFGRWLRGMKSSLLCVFLRASIIISAWSNRAWTVDASHSGGNVISRKILHVRVFPPLSHTSITALIGTLVYLSGHLIVPLTFSLTVCPLTEMSTASGWPMNSRPRGTLATNVESLLVVTS